MLRRQEPKTPTQRFQIPELGNEGAIYDLNIVISFIARFQCPQVLIMLFLLLFQMLLSVSHTHS